MLVFHLVIVSATTAYLLIRANGVKLGEATSTFVSSRDSCFLSWLKDARCQKAKSKAHGIAGRTELVGLLQTTGRSLRNSTAWKPSRTIARISGEKS